MRLIDADPLREQLKKRIEETESMLMCRSIETFMRLLDLTPTADVAPVRHGRWETIEWGVNHLGEIIIGRVYQCSECKRIIDLEHDETPNDYPYCHCGARMDGDNDE